MFVSLFFDVEDCVTPVSDDIARDLAAITADHGLVADFMVVGEKARTLERRGRRDVIEALGRHEIGLHTARHSRHPTVAEYLEDKGWADGIDEAVRREGPGVEAIRQVFGRTPACWGQGGGSWGPQIHPAMRRLGVPLIVYPATCTASSDVHWYSGVLTFGYRHVFEGFDQLYSDEAAFAAFFRTFQATVERYLAAGFPWMGIFCAHPITVRAYEFGDVLNFSHGRETPPEAWQQPPLKTEDEYRTALASFTSLIRYIAGHPRLQVVPVGTLGRRYGGDPTHIAAAELLSYAEGAHNSPDIPADDARLSPAQAVDVLTQAIASLADGASLSALSIRHVDGPVSLPPDLVSGANCPWEAFRAACLNTRAYIDRTGQLPAAIDLGGTTVGIGSFCRGACEALLALAAGHTPTQVALRPGAQVPAIAEEIARETEAGYRGWVIHKPDLDTARLLELTRLQTWTLRRAVEVEGR